jgi:TolB-like protein
MGLITELKRRNVFRVAIAYTVIAWVLAQVADLAFDNFGTPEWVPKSVLFVLALGFPLAIFFAWAFEMTPEGVKREKDVDRSQSITHKTGRKLDYVIIAVLVIAVGLLLADKFVLRESPTTTDAGTNITAVTVKSVAVLPFVAMSSGPDDEYFADGLTEEILNSLAQLPGLLVTARTSAFAFKSQDLSVTDIAAKLGVAHVVEGSVRRAGDLVRITAQLIRANDGFHLWSETYERSGEDSFGVQSEIAEKVAAALDVVLDDEQLARMRSSGLHNPEAFIAYQKGLELMARAHEGDRTDQTTKLLAANKFFERIMELEPGFSEAYFDHADYYIHFVLEVDEPGEMADEIAEALVLAEQDFRSAARTAKTEGDRLNATLELALISGQWRRLPEVLSAAYRSPDCIPASWWGSLSSILYPSELSLAFWQHSVACDPLNWNNWVSLGSAQFSFGDHEAAIQTSKRGMEVAPHSQIAGTLIYAYVATGRFDDALATSQRYIEDEQNRHDFRFMIAAAMGDADKAQRLLDELVEMYGAEPRVARFAMLGDRERASQLAATEDAVPLGFLNLLNEIGRCYCGAPFDLGVTPNFARLIEEGDFLWPPPEPIDWPLKDW